MKCFSSHNDRVLNCLLGTCVAAGAVVHFAQAARSAAGARAVALVFVILLVCSNAIDLFETAAWGGVTRSWQPRGACGPLCIPKNS